MSSKRNINENLSNTRENELDQQNTSFSRFPQGINNSSPTASTSKILPDTSRFKKNLRIGNHSSCSQISSDLPFGLKYREQYRFSYTSHDEFSNSERIHNDSVNNSLFQEPNASSHLNAQSSNLAESPIPFSPHPRGFLPTESSQSNSHFSSRAEDPIRFSPHPRGFVPTVSSHSNSHFSSRAGAPIRFNPHPRGFVPTVSSQSNSHFSSQAGAPIRFSPHPRGFLPTVSSQSNSHFSSRAEAPIRFSPHPRGFLPTVSPQSNSHFSSRAGAPIRFSPHPREFLPTVTVRSQNEIPNSYNYSQMPLERKLWLNEYPPTLWYQPWPVQCYRPIVGRQSMHMNELYPSANYNFNAQSVPPTPTTFSNIPPTTNMNRFTATEYDDISYLNKLPNNRLCTFCRTNGEIAAVYKTHNLKKKIRNKEIVICPVLRSLVCTICGESGDKAHTITYCPVLIRNNNGQRLESMAVALRNTRFMSNGRRRY